MLEEPACGAARYLKSSRLELNYEASRFRYLELTQLYGQSFSPPSPAAENSRNFSQGAHCPFADINQLFINRINGKSGLRYGESNLLLTQCGVMQILPTIARQIA